LQKAHIQEKKNAFFRKLASWIDVQAFYLPTVVNLRNEALRKKDKDENDLHRIELFLPSQIKNSLNWEDRLCRLGEQGQAFPVKPFLPSQIYF
jgi:hypothetical protein